MTKGVKRKVKNSMDEEKVRVCPECNMPAWIRHGNEFHGPWPEIDNNVNLAGAMLVCQDCGWKGAWEECDYEELW